MRAAAIVFALAEELENGDGEAVEGDDQCSEAQEQAGLHLRQVGLGGEVRQGGLELASE